MKTAVMQNAGVNIYENYFESCADSANVLQCYHHPYSDVMISHQYLTLTKSQFRLIISIESSDESFLFD